MNKITLKILTGVILASSVTQTAFGSGDPFNGVSGSSVYSSLATTMSSAGGWEKTILDAKEDASTFVLSNGKTRGVNLQKALELIRLQKPTLQMSDMELAQAILAE